jgi:hypothetical protein
LENPDLLEINNEAGVNYIEKKKTMRHDRANVKKVKRRTKIVKKSVVQKKEEEPEKKEKILDSDEECSEGEDEVHDFAASPQKNTQVSGGSLPTPPPLPKP